MALSDERLTEIRNLLEEHLYWSRVLHVEETLDGIAIGDLLAEHDRLTAEIAALQAELTQLRCRQRSEARPGLVPATGTGEVSDGTE